MLYNLLVPLSEDISFLNLFRYLTFRTGGAVMTALVISFILGPAVIAWLKKKQREGQPIRTDGPEPVSIRRSRARPSRSVAWDSGALAATCTSRWGAGSGVGAGSVAASYGSG